MNKTSQEGRSTLLTGTLLFFLCLIIYILTLCPTVYWYDSGELISACYHLGIAHPTGYPLYTMLGRIFALLPLGSIALRVNAMSAFFGALTAVALYLIMKMSVPLLWREIHPTGKESGRLARVTFEVPSIVASLTFAFSPLLWTQTAIAEVYTIHTFLIALLILTLILWARTSKRGPGSEKVITSGHAENDRFICLFGFLLGLSCGHHLTTLLFIPAFFFFIITIDWRIITRYRLITAVSFFFLLGLSVDFYLLIRAGLDPLQNWGNPDTWTRFKDVITGLEIRSRPTRYAPHSVVELFSFLSRQFLLPGLILGALGIYSTLRRHFRLFLCFSLFFVGMILYILRNYDFLADQYLPVFLVFALWIGLGAKELIFRFLSITAKGQTRTRTVVSLALCLLLLAFPFSLFALRYSSLNMSHQRIACNYGEHVLEALEPEAILLSEGSNIPLLLYYHQRVEEKRSDVANIYLFLMDFQWYREQLSQRYPEMSVPVHAEDVISRFLEQNLQRFPVYYSPFSKEPNIDINRLVPQGFIFRIEQGRTIPSKNDIRNHFRIQDSFYGSVADPLEQASKDILTQVHGTMGLYFEGMGMYDEAFREYSRALEIDSLNPGVHYDLGSLAMGGRMFNEAIGHFQKVLHLEPSNVQTRYLLSQGYIQTGDFDCAIGEMEHVVHSEPDEPRFRLELGVLYAQTGKVAHAIEQFEDGLDIDPHQVDLLYNLGIGLAKSGYQDQAIQYLERAEREDSTSVEIAYALASSYAEKKNFNKAEYYFLKALKLSGPNPSILEDLGYLYREGGDMQKAIEVWEYSLRLDASNTRLQKELHHLKEKRNPEEPPETGDHIGK